MISRNERYQTSFPTEGPGDLGPLEQGWDAIAPCDRPTLSGLPARPSLGRATGRGFYPKHHRSLADEFGSPGHAVGRQLMNSNRVALVTDDPRLACSIQTHLKKAL